MDNNSWWVKGPSDLRNENLIYVSSIKTVHRDKESDHRGKRSKTLSEVKPVKNINKNLQSFLEISPVEKEVLPSHKLKDHVYVY